MPVLDLMQNAFGFLRAPGASENALARSARRADLTLATGVFGESLDWSLIGLGALATATSDMAALRPPVSAYCARPSLFVAGLGARL
ncbi:hypothetical protein [Mycolicibacterium litorale]|uniref:hypothetical protein n=1 Tax=Mycolicibacterium litorale TaxID=758802 RepID=UPI00106655BC|nr:hypothetical protein [Mycolicibacterium litorale]MCV7416521.1 hypothetical protein [Mycolicibacterium litorale]